MANRRAMSGGGHGHESRGASWRSHRWSCHYGLHPAGSEGRTTRLRKHWGVKTVGLARVRKPAGAQAALWAYAFVALLALFPPAMTDDMLPIALVYSLIGLYVAGLFVVDLVGKLDHGVLWSWIAVTAIVAVIVSPTVAQNL